MPTKKLPPHPSLVHLKGQAKDLIKAQADAEPDALQRIREFCPHLHGRLDSEIAASPLTLSASQLTIAREHGFASWTRLKRFVETESAATLDLPHHERIVDAEFRKAVDLMDAGDADGLREHLTRFPALVHRRVFFEGGNYFSNPTLLEFVAENPIRHGTISPEVLRVTRTLLDAGARSGTATLVLVSSGRIAREQGFQIPLIELLCSYGADPNAAMSAALGHAEFAAADALLRLGARIDLPVAAALDRLDDAQRLIPIAGSEDRHRALALATLHGRCHVARMLLESGEDPSRYNPEGCHSHSTPLHQAALRGDELMVRLLLDFGARTDLKDTHFGGTSLGWAKHADQRKIIELLGSA